MVGCRSGALKGEYFHISTFKLKLFFGTGSTHALSWLFRTQEPGGCGVQPRNTGEGSARIPKERKWQRKGGRVISS